MPATVAGLSVQRTTARAPSSPAPNNPYFFEGLSTG
jgi:hypothetical protein